ncbi:hypothetical protein [Polaromonas sp. LjRoot131]|jgi:hypothetical protein|uniref:hypothetical protein n=1 Tax=Polaromonas sp. LjRoot131 TaxID=3342262 RepID=UPI003ECEB5C0
MPNLKSSRKESVRVQVVSAEDEYWTAVQRLKGTFEFFEEQGDAHGHIDGDLQDAIEAVLVPLAGSWERSDVWFHNQDFYGNGVRSLTFRAVDFPWLSVVSLQKLLVGDAARFCISVVLFDTLEVGSKWVSSVAILQDQLVVTPSALEMLRKHFGVET